MYTIRSIWVMSRRAYLLCLVVAGLASCGLSGCDGLSFRSPPPPPTLSERQAVAEANRRETTPAAPTPAPAPQPTQPTRPPQAFQPYTEWTLSQTAEDALGRIGPAAVPQLSQMLQDQDPAVRQMAARILARIGPDAVKAVPDLIELLQDRHPQVQRAAARALGQIGPEAAAAAPALLRLLDASSTESVELRRPPGSS